MMEIKEKMTEQKRKIDYLRRGKLDVEDNVKKMKVSYRMVNEGFERVVLLHLFSYNEVHHSKFVFTDAFMLKTCITFSFSAIISFSNTFHAIVMVNFNISFPFFLRFIAICYPPRRSRLFFSHSSMLGALSDVTAGGKYRVTTIFTMEQFPIGEIRNGMLRLITL